MHNLDLMIQAGEIEYVQSRRDLERHLKHITAINRGLESLREVLLEKKTMFQQKLEIMVEILKNSS